MKDYYYQQLLGLACLFIYISYIIWVDKLVKLWILKYLKSIND